MPSQTNTVLAVGNELQTCEHAPAAQYKFVRAVHLVVVESLPEDFFF